MANPNPNSNPNPNPTDHEISRALQTLVRESQSNPNPNPNPSNPNSKTAPIFNSFNDVVQHLQSKLGADLSHKLDFINSQIQLLFQPPQHPHVPKDHFALHQTPNYHNHHHHHHHHQQPQHQLHQPHPHPHHHQQQQQPSVSAFHSFPPHHQPHPVQAKPDVSSQFVPVSLPDPSPGKESAAPVKARRRGGPGGLNKLCSVSPELQTIVGQSAMPRTEIVKQLWAYIRKNNLQDPSNKRKIICNDELRVVFETDCTDMFKMNKLLAKHIGPLEPTKVSASKKQKVEVEAEVRSPESGPSVKISEALANFFGVSEREMLQSEITKRIWEYINVNHLQDPRNSMVINCDEKLQEIFGCESIPALGIPEVLARHHLIRRS